MNVPGSVVIVGGGISGISVCQELRRRDFTGAVTLIDSGEVLHDRPPLSKDFLLGTLDADAIRLQPQEWFTENHIEVLTGACVQRVMPHAVELVDGQQVPADAVVLATGGAARRLSVPGSDDERVLVLRDLPDAQRLRRQLGPDVRVLVVGGGLVGAEVAATARTLGAEVFLTDPMLPLEHVVGAPIAQWLHAMHRRHGVTVYQAGVERIIPGDAGVTVQLTDHSEVSVDVVVVGIGMEPRTDIAARSRIEVDQGIVVDEQQRTSAANVWAVGDCARTRSVDGTLLPRVEHWENATQSAARAVASMLGEQPPIAGSTWFWSDRYGHHVEVAGHPTAGEQIIRGELGTPPFAQFTIADGYVIGVVSVDDPQSVRAGRRLIERRIPITAEELSDRGVDLKSLARKR